MATTYEIRHSNGRREQHATYQECLDALTEWYGERVEIGHDGDLTSGGDRTLVWACEEDSVDDDGARACASIVRVPS